MPKPVGWLLTLLPCQDPKVSLALQCLESSATDDLYTQALLAYVFGLAGRGEQQRALLQSLAQHNVSQGTPRCGQGHLQAMPPSAWVTPFCPRDRRSRGLSPHLLLSQAGSSTGRGRQRLDPPRSPPGLSLRRRRWR